MLFDTLKRLWLDNVLVTMRVRTRARDTIRLFTRRDSFSVMRCFHKEIQEHNTSVQNARITHHIYICKNILMCEALPPTLEKVKGDWMSWIKLAGCLSYAYVYKFINMYIFIYIYIYLHICIHIYRHSRITPCDSRGLFLRPAVCI